MAKRAKADGGGMFEKVDTFVRDYTAGLGSTNVGHTLRKDLERAYAVLARDHMKPGEVEPAHRAPRLFHRAKILFLGVSYKLSPQRRLIFAGALLAALMAMFGDNFVIRQGAKTTVSVSLSPLFFTLAIGGLVYVLVVELVDRVLVRDELEVARGVQRDLMPKADPALPGYAFAHSYRTAAEVGGDFYDFISLADGRFAIAIGDASGHGMAAGLLMAIGGATLRTAVELDPDPESVVRLVHRALARERNRRGFMTLFYALLEPATGRMRYVSCAHPFPLLARADGTVEELGNGSLPLGLKSEPRAEVGETTIQPGDRLVLYTDGLPEAIGTPPVSPLPGAKRPAVADSAAAGEAASTHGAAFGFGALRDLAATAGSARATHDRILARFARHVGDEPLADDLSLVVLERLA